METWGYEEESLKGDIGISYHHVPISNLQAIEGRYTERPKVALQSHFSIRGLVSHFLIHVLALMATGAIVQLTFRRVYWSDESVWASKWYLLGLGQADTANLLQFVAKIHEILMVGSLSVIVFHMARRMLVSERGIPFGLLMGGYQASSPEYLVSGTLWSPFIQSIRRREWRPVAFSVCLILAIVFANTLGPFSAVAIEPNLDWYELTDPFEGQDFTSYIFVTPEELYPRTLDATYVQNYKGACSSSNAPFSCPGAGFSGLYNWAYAYSMEGVDPNITVVQELGRAQRELSAAATAQSDDDRSAAVIAASLHSSVVDLTGLFWHYVTTHAVGAINSVGRPQFAPSGDSAVLAPLVQVQCSAVDYASALQTNNVTFQADLLNDFGDPLSADSYGGNPVGWPVPASAWNYSHAFNGTRIEWVDLSGYRSAGGQALNASVGALVYVPYILNHTQADGVSNVVSQNSWLLSCVVDARWAASEVTFDPTTSDLVSSNLTDLTPFFPQQQQPAATAAADTRAKYGLSGPIAISPAWMALLNPAQASAATATGDAMPNATATEALLLPFVSRYDLLGFASGLFQFDPPHWNVALASYATNVSETVATVLGMAVTEGLSRVALDFDGLWTVTDAADPRNLTVVDLQKQAGALEQAPVGHVAPETFNGMVAVRYGVLRYGWGYGFQTRTVTLGVCVLLAHAALVAAYLAASVWFWAARRGWRSAAWADAGELVALALSSRPAGPVRNTGAGIRHRDTWRLNVGIRERGGHDDDQLELVVSTAGGGGIARGEFRDGPQSIPVAGKKYR